MIFALSLWCLGMSIMHFYKDANDLRGLWTLFLGTIGMGIARYYHDKQWPFFSVKVYYPKGDEYMKPFPEMWDLAKNLGSDLENLAESLYNACEEAKLPETVIQELMNIIALLHSTDGYYEDHFHTEEDAQEFQTQVRGHKHLATGEAVIDL